MEEKVLSGNEKPHLAWIFPGRLDNYLSAAAWLNMSHELRNIGWKVTLINFGERGFHQVRGEEVLGIPCMDVYLLRQITFHLNVLGYLLSNWRSIDVILMGPPSAFWVLPLRFLRLLQHRTRPVLMMDTRTIPMEDAKKASIRDKLRGDFSLLMNRLGNHWADGQTAITQRMADCVHIPPDRLWGVWSSGVKLEQFSNALTNRIWPTGDEPVVLAYVGILHYERNLMALCKATEMANHEGMNFNLSLTGWGTEKEDLEKFALQSEGRIRVNPAIPNDQIPGLLEKVHVGVLPFPDEEKYRVCSPIKLFEYMAAGLPVFATRVVCFSDVIKDDSYTFWSDDATPEGLLSTLRRIWASRENLREMGNRSVQAASLRTWQESGRRLNEALNFGLLSSIHNDLKQSSDNSINWKAE
jgi:glycosyltransferase involved in cell wall biosynthesis